MLDNCLTKHCITNIFDSLLFLGTFEVLIGIATVIYSDYREGLKTDSNGRARFFTEATATN